MSMNLWRRSAVSAAGVIASFLLLTPPVQAAPCADLPDFDAAKSVFGAGGSAITPTLRNVAVALAGLPAEDRLRIFFADPGACTGYAYFRTPTATEISFRYWDSNNVEYTCEAPQTSVQFGHMGNTPALCPMDVPLLDGQAKFVAPVQTVNFITHYGNTSYLEIWAEALYHIYGLGAGAAGHSVAPWNDQAAVYGRAASAFVTQLVAGSIGVPATTLQSKLLPANVLVTNGNVVSGVYAWGTGGGDVTKAIGYVSGSNANQGEFVDNPARVKTLAYQHYGQTCAYLPDSVRGRADKANVRSGQYWVWTPAWFYAHVDANGVPTNQNVANLIAWFDGTANAPGDVDVQEIVVKSGDVPLCAMHAMRPEGDLSEIVSYAPENPCNGWYEFTATGSTDYETCTTTDDCDGDDQVCRFGYCEAY